MNSAVLKPPSRYSTVAPDGTALELAFDAGTDPYGALISAEARRAYYAEQGYLVRRGLVAAALCDAARQAFAREVRPYGGFLYRQASAKAERHDRTAEGYVRNSLLNLQDLDRRAFAATQDATLAILAGEALEAAAAELLGAPPVIVQTMYFEGNPVTWAHQDTYYLDAEPLGSMTAAWVALEDIHPGAGRFYVYPGSHRIDMLRNGGDFEIAFHHDRYKALVLDVIRRHGLRCHAPALRKGDVLFWNSKTIHGSLTTSVADHSRSSLTAHYIPRGSRFLQWQRRPRRLRLHEFHGRPVHCPKDQNRTLPRLSLRLQAAFPGLHDRLKRQVTRLMLR